MALTKRTSLLVSVPAVLVLIPTLVAAPASAEPPPNDDISGAITVTRDSSTPFDSTEATPDLSDRCVGDKSVWFRYEHEGGRTSLTTAGSSFDTTMAIFTGRRSALDLYDCDHSSGPGDSSSEQLRRTGLYWIAISSDTAAGGPGVLSIGRTATPVDVIVEGARSGGASGRLIAFGTVACEGLAEFQLRAVASQRVGDNVARGQGWTGRGRMCSEDPTPWQLRIDSDTGWAFQPGPVSVRVRTSSWNGLESSVQARSATVTAVDDPDARTAP